MWQDLFQSGTLLLPDSHSQALPPTESAFPLSGVVLIMLFLLLAILQLRRFFDLLPSLWDSVFRARGSARLENSYRLSHDRTVLALTLLLPAILIAFRYKLYYPSFLQGMESNLYLLSVAGVAIGYCLLRSLMFLWLRPRRNRDNYNLSGRAAFTFFILLMILVLATVGVCALFSVNDLTIRNLIYVESAVAYGIFLLRRAQILSLNCNPLRTFLYLCGLEFFPTALLIVTAVFL